MALACRMPSVLPKGMRHQNSGVCIGAARITHSCRMLGSHQIKAAARHSYMAMKGACYAARIQQQASTRPCCTLFPSSALAIYLCAIGSSLQALL